jgi:tetratricopeptide (TPR) repeat protein
MKKISLLLLVISLCFACRKNTVEIPDTDAPSPMMCAPQLSDADWYKSNTPAPLFEGMDLLSYPVTTKSAEAQKYFNQGLLLSYAFNHAEAARSFYQAMRLDSTCAMCYWGYAFVLGPNYNAGMDADHYERAYEAMKKANAYSGPCTPKEKAMIKAMTLRYVKEAPQDRRALDSAYMEAMKLVHEAFPKDVDIACLYAESLMDMHPWDLWEKDGKPKPWTPYIIKAIEEAIDMDSHHPGGHHYYIHALEASPFPERALASAKMFDNGLVARAGHLVHMPSHIYINTGDYHLGSLANINALKQDSTYVTQCHAQGAYPLAYYPHNYHFLAATATLEGKSEWAIDAANKMAKHVNHKGMLIPDLATLQHYYAIPYFVNVKFGKWQAILRFPEVDSNLLYPAGIRHYARGMAFLGLKDIEHAKQELIALQDVAEEDTLKKLTIWGINSLYTVTDIAQKVLEGELLAAMGKTEESIKMLKEAVELEDQLNYNEPPDWFFSVRHHLGAVLVGAGKPDEAIKVYLDDLERFPKNGWALSGLMQAYRDANQKDKAAETEVKFNEAWAHADVTLSGSIVK